MYLSLEMNINLDLYMYKKQTDKQRSKHLVPKIHKKRSLRNIKTVKLWPTFRLATLQPSLMTSAKKGCKLTKAVSTGNSSPLVTDLSEDTISCQLQKYLTFYPPNASSESQWQDRHQKGLSKDNIKSLRYCLKRLHKITFRSNLCMTLSSNYRSVQGMLKRSALFCQLN